MGRSSKQKRRDRKAASPARAVEVELATKPLRVAQSLSVAVLLLGALMFILGGGVVLGYIKNGWGFPMSEVPNWGRPWGGVLIVAATAYIACPILLLIRPRKGWLAMMIVSGLSVLVGTPLITTSVEIFFNLFQATTSRPGWVEPIWGYYIITHVAICIALYKADANTSRASAGRQPQPAKAGNH